jgi:hypothetical protein
MFGHLAISHSFIVDWFPRFGFPKVFLILKSSSKSFHFVTKLLVLIDLLLSNYLVIVCVVDNF